LLISSGRRAREELRPRPERSQLIDCVDRAKETNQKKLIQKENIIE